MIERGLRYLREIQYTSLARVVCYRSLGRTQAELRCTLGKSEYRVPNDYGGWVRVTTQDFIVPHWQFNFMPTKGDIIEFAGREYEVLAPNNEPVWRWSDPYHTALRIHTKRINGDD